jgi:hypothetical protein
VATGLKHGRAIVTYGYTFGTTAQRWPAIREQGLHWLSCRSRAGRRGAYEASIAGCKIHASPLLARLQREWFIGNHLDAGVVQWQNGSFPSFIRGFDSLHPLQLMVPSYEAIKQPLIALAAFNRGNKSFPDFQKTITSM